MCIGPDEGCQLVPDPIAPIDMTLVSLDPTRMPTSLPDMTISGPMLIPPIPGMLSMPFMFLRGLLLSRRAFTFRHSGHVHPRHIHARHVTHLMFLRGLLLSRREFTFRHSGHVHPRHIHARHVAHLVFLRGLPLSRYFLL